MSHKCFQEKVRDILESDRCGDCFVGVRGPPCIDATSAVYVSPTEVVISPALSDILMASMYKNSCKMLIQEEVVTLVDDR